ncbi:MAG: CotH kinase family protein [Mariniblastus sp.]|nr:CotH kinase family protein [Mariniblastus sp.]
MLGAQQTAAGGKTVIENVKAEQKRIDMIEKSKLHKHWLTGCMMLLFSASQPALSASAQEPEDAAFWKSVFAKNRVLELQVEVTRKAWDAMQPSRERRERDGQQYTYVRANITIDGQPFDDAGLRFKGNSSFRATGPRLKKPFKIDLNRFTKGQKLHGRTKLNLSNSFLDPAFMKEKLAYELYRAAGLPTPGVGWANLTLVIEGVADPIPLGIYVLVEQVDQRFLASNLGEASQDSLLMKPEVEQWDYIDDDPNSYRSYNIKSGEKNIDQLRAFASLLKLIERAPDAAFEREIGDRIDLKQLAGYLAATSILANLDSYVGMPHNYYLVMDKADGKMRILPWDVNEAFGTFTMFAGAEDLAQWDIDRPWMGSNRLLERLFAMESFSELYRSSVERLMQEAFTQDLLFGRIAEFEKALSPYVAKSDSIFWLNESTLKQKPVSHLDGLQMGIDGDPAGLNRAVRRKILGIKPFILRRIESINAQLEGRSKGKALRR